jgi:hypothetical protein
MKIMHYAKTSNREKALEYAIKAGERAHQLYANQDAATYLSQALELLDEEKASNQARKLAVLEALGDVHELLADFGLATTAPLSPAVAEPGRRGVAGPGSRPPGSTEPG